jgi:predicted lipid-binding transport protein (Tim44 family)
LEKQNMIEKRGIKIGSVLAAALFILMYILPLDVEARFGGGRSFGSRGSRSTFGSSNSYSSTPSKSYSSQTTRNPGSPATPPQSGGFLRNMAGGLAGGFLGAMLFSSLGFGAPGVGGLGGGIGMMDILLIGLVLFGIYWFIKKRRQEKQALAGAQYYQGETADTAYQPAYGEGNPSTEKDLSGGLRDISRMDASFSAEKFRDQAMDFFFKVQAAWAKRDLAGMRSLLTDEVYQAIQGEADRLRQEKKINRLDNIAVRSVDIVEAWQESGEDFLTVKFLANLLDYTVDEVTGNVVAGSKDEPVRFEEYWTFSRPVGNNPWRLAAVDQAPG